MRWKESRLIWLPTSLLSHFRSHAYFLAVSTYVYRNRNARGREHMQLSRCTKLETHDARSWDRRREVMGCRVAPQLDRFKEEARGSAGKSNQDSHIEGWVEIIISGEAGKTGKVRRHGASQPCQPDKEQGARGRRQAWEVGMTVRGKSQSPSISQVDQGALVWEPTKGSICGSHEAREQNLGEQGHTIVGPGPMSRHGEKRRACLGLSQAQRERLLTFLFAYSLGCPRSRLDGSKLDCALVDAVSFDWRVDCCVEAVDHLSTEQRGTRIRV